MSIIDSKNAYKAPHVNVVEVNEKGAVCQSSGSGAVNIEGYTEDQLNW
ncbi:MAG: hypothetical protein MJY60_08380 [Bacteroidales bacterium]|nr:hypothetical protein [Bacteroidales bacterium]